MMKHKFSIFNFQFSILLLLCAVSVQAVEVSEVSGMFRGGLNIGGMNYADKTVYLLPGTEDNSVTFVLPDFTYNAGNLGNIVLPNIRMDANGRLTMENSTLYIKAIQERATISVLNGFQDGADTYNSEVSKTSAQVLLEIAAPSLPEPILVLFAGEKVTGRNYAIQNGGFEGNWSNNEPAGWHSFPSATGSFASMVSGNTDQFQRSTEKRPGSAGSQSVQLQSKITAGVKANGNCTNGRINAGSMTADDASGNYGFSEPGTEYATAFVGQPDSLVFWAKYIPADQNPSNSVNKARAHAVITTNARYQDPEAADYSAVKVAEAAINYAATSSMGWQRLSVPFNYTTLDPQKAAYMLITFTTNMTPGGGSSYSEGGLFNKTYYLDNVYVDDAEMIYNHGLAACRLDGAALTFNHGQASVDKPYSDSDYQLETTADGRAAKTFVGYDGVNSCVYIYVVADNYPQAQAYTLYTVQMQAAGPQQPDNTSFSYEATTCDNEAYTDDLFHGLTQAGVYTDTIPNMQGGDSIVTLTLHVLPSYRMEETRYLNTVDIIWHGQAISGLPQAEEPYVYYDSLVATNGCDSVYVLKLYVSEVPVTYSAYEAAMCEGETVSYEGVTYSEPFEGDIHVAAPNMYGGDSIVHLRVSVLPNYTIDQYMTITRGQQAEWEGWNLSTMPEGEMELQAWYYTEQECDSILVLHLTVLPQQIGTGCVPTEASTKQVRKVLYTGQLFIIREDETIYDILGNKFK